MNRITSTLWVSALVRREQANGAFCTVIKKGAEQAGAIFVVYREISTDKLSLFEPAPQSYFEEGENARKFERVLIDISEAEVQTYLHNQRKFDPDIWIIEIESTETNLELEI